MNIFLTNDDGYLSYGILGLAKKLSKKHTVTVVAPHNPQSAAGHALTMHKPLRIKYFEDLSEQYHADVYSCSGKPADCVILGIMEIMKEKPDLVISGINIGGNLGTDIIYSGTVSGALEASMMGYSAIAASLNAYEPDKMDTAIQYIDEFILRYPIQKLGKDYILNVNVPDVSYDTIKGIKVVGQGVITYNDIVTKGTDPFGTDFYWIGGTRPDIEDGQLDINYIAQGYVTVTPITYMMTSHAHLEAVEQEIENL